MVTNGLQGFFIHKGLAHIFIIVSLICFINGQEVVAEDDQAQYQVVPPRATSIAMEAIAQEAEVSQLLENAESTNENES